MRLQGKYEADAVIVGGGLTGLSTALQLGKSGLKAVIVEAGRIGECSNISRVMPVAPAYGAFYAKMEKEKGIASAIAHVQIRRSAFRCIQELLTKNSSLALQQIDAYLVQTDKGSEKAEAEAEAMRRAGIAVDPLGEGKDISGCKSVRFGPAYLINVSIYLQILANAAKAAGILCFEGSRIIETEPDAVYSEQGSVIAPYIVIATGYPIVNIPGWYFVRLEQNRSEVLRQNNPPFLRKAYFSLEDSSSVYADEHNAWVKCVCEPVGKNKQFGTGSVKQLFPDPRFWQVAEQAGYSVEIETQDRLPYIGRYSPAAPGVYVGTGFGADWVIGSMVAAHSITAQIMGLPSEGYEIYSPQRPLSGVEVPMKIVGRMMRGVIAGSNTPRCSHMGCGLRYNSKTKLWECSCHGSCFDLFGRVVQAPAIKTVQLKKRKK